MSVQVSFQGKRVMYSYMLYCKNDFGARPSFDINLDLKEVASKVSRSQDFRLGMTTHNYIVLEHGETIVSIMRNGEMLIQKVPRGDPKEVESIISKFFTRLD